MVSTKLLVAGGAVAAVAATAILVPVLAFGQPLGAVVGARSAPSMTDDRRMPDGPGHGQGNAWGHHKDDPGFPGQGRGLDKDSDDFPGQGRGLDKDSDDFPGHGNGLGKNRDD